MSTILDELERIGGPEDIWAYYTPSELGYDLLKALPALIRVARAAEALQSAHCYDSLVDGFVSPRKLSNALTEALQQLRDLGGDK